MNIADQPFSLHGVSRRGPELLHTQHAFTLIEVSLVLFILGMLIAMGLPMLKDFILHTDDELMRSQLLHAIQLARKEARARGISTVICKSDDRWHCKNEAKNSLMVFLNENEDGIVPAKEQILAVIQMLSSHGILYWRAFPGYRDYLLFSARQIMQTDNGTFWYCHESVHPAWAVMLNKSGRTRVVYPDKNNEIKDAQGRPLLCPLA